MCLKNHQLVKKNQILNLLSSSLLPVVDFIVWCGHLVPIYSTQIELEQLEHLVQWTSANLFQVRRHVQHLQTHDREHTSSYTIRELTF